MSRCVPRMREREPESRLVVFFGVSWTHLRRGVGRGKGGGRLGNSSDVVGKSDCLLTEPRKHLCLDGRSSGGIVRRVELSEVENSRISVFVTSDYAGSVMSRSKVMIILRTEGE